MACFLSFLFFTGLWPDENEERERLVAGLDFFATAFCLSLPPLEEPQFDSALEKRPLNGDKSFADLCPDRGKDGWRLDWTGVGQVSGYREREKSSDMSLLHVNLPSLISDLG